MEDREKSLQGVQCKGTKREQKQEEYGVGVCRKESKHVQFMGEVVVVKEKGDGRKQEYEESVQEEMCQGGEEEIKENK